MRLGSRKANSGSRRGPKTKANTINTPTSAASSSGTGANPPPACPEDDASGLGGSGHGTGIRGRTGGAARPGRGEALAGRAARFGEGLAVEGEP
mgnify:FL=1|jgi:hypothetical protein